MSATAVIETPTRTVTVITAPYVGLTYFTEADSAVFFGREAERRLISTTLLASRFTVIYGESGVGKSSLLRAGAVHDLRELALRELSEGRSGNGGRRPSHVALVFADWQDDPVAKLDLAIAEAAAAYGLPAKPVGATTFYELIERWAELLDTTLVIVLDQFEEYLLYHPAADDDLGVGLAQAIENPDLSVRFAIGIREDALAKLDRFEDLIPNLFDNYVRVDHLDEAAGEAAIRGPIDRYNEARPAGKGPVELDDALVGAVLAQVRTDAIRGSSTGQGTATDGGETTIEAPFLQLVMERLWEEDAASGRLSKETLDRLGGAQKIVLSYLDGAMKALSRREQDVAAAVFRDLVTPSGQKIAQTPADLAKLSGKDEARIRQGLELLASQRIVRPVAPAPESTDARYEIFHDKLADPILDWRSRQVARRARRRTRLYAAGALVMAAVAAGCVLLAVRAKQAEAKATRANQLVRSQRLLARGIQAESVNPVASIGFALRALAERPTPEAEALLRRAVPASLLRVVMRHPGPVYDARFSPDGSRILAATDKTAVLSDSQSGRTLAKIAFGSNVSTADLSSDGALIATAGWDNTVRVWDAGTGAEIGRPFKSPNLTSAWFVPKSHRIVALGWDGRVRVWSPGSPSPVQLDWRAYKAKNRGIRLDVAAFDRNGRHLVVAGASPVAWLYDLRTGHARALRGHTDTIAAVAFSPDGSKIVTGSNDERAIIWRASTARPAARPLKETSGVLSVAFSKDGSEVATSAGKRAHVWNALTGQRLAELRGHRDWVNDVEFRRDGKLAVTASSDGTARVWDIGAETTLVSLLGDTNIVRTAAFSPDGKQVVTASDDGSARTWDVDAGLELRTTPDWVVAAAFRPHSNQVFRGGADQEVTRWNAATGRLVGPLSGLPFESIYSLRVSGDGKRVAVGGSDVNAYVLDAASGKRIGELRANTAAIVDAAFNPAGTRVVTASQDGWAGVYPARGTQKLPTVWLHRDPKVEGGQATTRGLGLNSVDWSAGNLIATAGADGLVGIWDAKDGRLLATYRRHRGGVSSVRFDTSGRFAVTAGEDQTVQIWEVRSRGRKVTLSRRMVLDAHERIIAAAFSPDGRLVAVAGSEGTTRVWNWRERRLLAALHKHADFVNTVQFSPDGERLLSASDDGTAKIYGCPTCVPLARLKAVATEQTKTVEVPR